MEAAIIDATNLIVGRLASHVAKRLLQGERVIIVNAEKAVVSGKRRALIRRAREFLRVGGGPRYGPFHLRRPDTILRRVIRGMLPRDKRAGREAFKRLRVYIDVPEGLKGKVFHTVEDASVERLRGPYITLGELAREIGWRG